jgi:hypothetical protein
VPNLRSILIISWQFEKENRQKIIDINLELSSLYVKANFLILSFFTTILKTRLSMTSRPYCLDPDSRTPSAPSFAALVDADEFIPEFDSVGLVVVQGEYRPALLVCLDIVSVQLLKERTCHRTTSISVALRIVALLKRLHFYKLHIGAQHHSERLFDSTGSRKVGLAYAVEMIGFLASNMHEKK